ncbi:hypothetical protein BZG36_05649 [Bifiguratus adelaidae]|uniref:Uncharacterized protein n=1 Tax=Bifiguratus adelaidae TaxID=1938954 RepID=A0A261XTN0_9FUNG|nr:hypothetical protein BZG36_05649 [Bifiguratus adelaidae]
MSHFVVANQTQPFCLLQPSCRTLTLRYPPFDFDDDDFVLDFSTPDPQTLGSQSGNPTGSGGPRRGERAIPESSDKGLDSSSLHYTITWKLQLRKGRITKLTEDTIEDIEVAPGTYWKDVLESELASVVKSKVPEPQYEPDETRTIVSTSKRGEPAFQKRFDKLTIDWTVVENKLRSWSNQGNNLTVAISFIYKESQPTNKESKTGRGATNKHFAARDKLVARQEASGTRAVWKEVYQLLECSSAACTNRGFSCWRNNNKHYKLDSDVMDQLVDYAEEGNKLETHDDVPERIRELIHTRGEEDMMRKRKRRASESLPVTLRLCCHGHHNDASADCPDRPKGKAQSMTRGGRPVRLKFPMPKDEAPKLYSDWLCAQVTNQAWRASYRLASKVTIDKGYDLQRVDAEMLIANGVLPGIAIQYASRVEEWLDDVYSN